MIEAMFFSKKCDMIRKARNQIFLLNENIFGGICELEN